jgi:hypothetical protein
MAKPESIVFEKVPVEIAEELLRKSEAGRKSSGIPEKSRVNYTGNNSDQMLAQAKEIEA